MTDRDWRITIGLDVLRDDFRYALTLNGELPTHVIASRGAGRDMTLAPDQIVDVLRDPDLAALQPVIWPEQAQEFLTAWLSANWPDRYERLIGFDNAELDRDVERAMVAKHPSPRWVTSGRGALPPGASRWRWVLVMIIGADILSTALRGDWDASLRTLVLIAGMLAIAEWRARRERRAIRRRLAQLRSEHLDVDE